MQHGPLKDKLGSDALEEKAFSAEQSQTPGAYRQDHEKWKKL